MPERSLARSGEETNGRVARGRQLFAERYNEIEWIRGYEWYVPASALLNGRYVVRIGDNPTCECRDYTYRHRACKHIHAAQIAHAKSAVCSCCGSRVPNRFLTEVEGWHELLTWFVGDLICAECIRAGYWA